MTHAKRILAILLLGAIPASAETPEAIFKKTSPSIVAVRDAEGSASGVLISQYGLVLTNYSTVNTPLPIEVAAEVVQGGKRRTMTFKKTRVLGVHPTANLALLQIVNPGPVRFVPAIIDTRPVKIGEKVYVIGQAAYAGGEGLDRSIEHGQVVATGKRVAKATYAVSSAAITFDSSGGAVCDESGKVIGIAAFGLGRKQEVGFFVSLKGYRQSDLVPPARRAADKDRAAYLAERGRYWLGFGAGAPDAPTRRLAFFYYRLALTWDPGDPQLYLTVATIYEQMRKPDLARAFAAKALELRKDFPQARFLLGHILLEAKRHDQAGAEFRKGLTTARRDLPARRGVAGCAYGCALVASRRKRSAEAAYFARWSDSLVPADRFTYHTEAVGLFARVGKDISDEQFAYVTQARQFSLRDLAAYLRMRRNFTRPPPSAAELARHNQTVARLAKQMLKSASRPLPLRKRLPDAPDRIMWARYGCCLAMQFRGLRRVGIFNLARAEFDGYVPVPEVNTFVATGADVLLTYSPDLKRLDRWDLRTMKKTGSKSVAIPGLVKELVMGGDRSDLAIVAVIDPARRKATGDRYSHYLINVPDLTLVRVREGKLDYGGMKQSLAANPWMSALTAWNHGGDSRIHPRASLIVLDGTMPKLCDADLGVYAGRSFSPSHDGARAIMNYLTRPRDRRYGDPIPHSRILDEKLKILHAMTGQLAWVYNRPYLVHRTKDGKCRLLDEKNAQPIGELSTSEGAPSGLWPAGPVGRLALADEESDWVHIVPLPLPAAGKETGKP